MKKITIYIFLLLSIKVFSQQIPIHTMYLDNNFLINPAVAGYNHCWDIRLQNLTQMSGFATKPNTQAVTFHTRVERVGKYDHSGNIQKKTNIKKTGRVGLGGYIFNDSNGPFSRKGFSFTYAYHIIFDKIKNQNLSLGLSLGMYQYAFNTTVTNQELLADQAVINAQEPVLLPEANFGAYYYSTKFFFSFSATQLFQNALSIGSKNASDYSYRSRIYIGGGYKYNINEIFDVSGSVFIKTYEVKFLQLDINPKLYYKSNYWIGLSIRTANSIHYALGLKYKMINISYAYIRSFGNVNNYINGSHSLMIGIILNEKRTIDNYL